MNLLKPLEVRDRLTIAIPMVSRVTTLDGRLTRNQTYAGRLVDTSRGLRVEILLDNRSQRMTFNPQVFSVKRG